MLFIQENTVGESHVETKAHNAILWIWLPPAASEVWLYCKSYIIPEGPVEMS